MTTLYSTQGTIRFPIKAGNSLIVTNTSGIETVSGSSTSREDASSVLGSGVAVYGPQTSDSTILISTTGQCEYEIRAGDPTPSMDSGAKNFLANSGFSGASQLQRAAQRYARKYRAGLSRLIGIGDSYMQGSGATGIATAFWGLLNTELGSAAYNITNYGFGGRPISAYTKAPLVYGSGASTTEVLQPLIDDVYFGILGLNDIRGISDLGGTTGGCGPNPANLRNMISRTQAVATWFMVPETSRVRAHTANNSGANPAVTYAGSWTHTGFQGYLNVSYSTATSSTATFTSTYGDLLIIRLATNSTATATLQISVDGVVQHTGTSKGEFDSWAIDSIIIKCPTKAQHTVVITHLTGDNVMFHSCDCVDTSTDFSGTLVYSTPGNLPDGATLGWSDAGGNANGANAQSATGSAIWLYNAGGLERFRAAIDNAMSALFELGFNVVNARHWVDWNLNAHIYTDNVHPNDAGHKVIANAFRHPLRLLAGI